MASDVQEPSGSDRRIYERLGVIVPIELRVYDTPGGQLIRGPFHALVTDVSEGGLRVDLLGPAAEAFRVGSFVDVPVSIHLMLKSLKDLGPMPCNVRWVQPTPHGISIGVQLSGQLMQDKVLRTLVATVMRPMPWRSGMQIGVVGAAIVLIAGLGALSLQSLAEQDALRTQVGELSQSLQDAQRAGQTLQRTVEASRAQTQRLQQQVVACAQQAADPDDAAAPEDAPPPEDAAQKEHADDGD